MIKKAKPTYIAKNPLSEKYCCHCDEVLDISEFSINCRGHYVTRCRPCTVDFLDTYRQSNRAKALADKRRHHLWSTFGITVEEYEAMDEAQESLCAICHLPETQAHQNGVTKRLAVDHCHETGTIRGLLCGNCNRGVGYFYDDVPRVLAAAKYLASADRQKFKTI